MRPDSSDGSTNPTHGMGDRVDPGAIGRRPSLSLSNVRSSARDEHKGELKHALSRARLRLSEQDQRIYVLESRVVALESELAELHASISWRSVQHLSRLARRIAPISGRRRAILRRGARAVAVVYRATKKCVKVAAIDPMRRSRLAFDRIRSKTAAENRRRREDSLRLREIRSNPPVFPRLDRPLASIIIPVHNHCYDTYRCLKSIESETKGSYEVVLIDDASTDMTSELVRCATGIVSIRNEKNLGFVGSCNRGAAAARGEYLVFLNNDTLTTPGWLDALLRTFDDHPRTGLVGAKLVYPDGRLQEAGGAIWNDASGWNYGKFADPDHPSYNFVREVDYCSGACVAIPRTLFHSLGGFDDLYAPAYYEDVDLAFKVRHSGRSVVYQPAAKIIHFEGLTSGTNVESGVKSYQVVNRIKFRNRWSERLLAHPEPPGEMIRIVRAHGDPSAEFGSVLIIDHRMPTPDRDAGSVRMMEIIKSIRRSGRHVVFIPDNLAPAEPYGGELRRIGVETICFPHYLSIDSFLEAHGEEFDLVIISRPDITEKHLDSVKLFASKALVAFDTVDLHFLREEREARIKRNDALLQKAKLRKRQELDLTRRCDVTLVVSEHEKAILELELPGIDVRIIPTIVKIDDAPRPPFEARNNIVFIGGFEHTPNADAVLYFAREVMPLIRERRPGVVFQVIGPDAPDEIRALACADIEIVGFVAEVEPYFDRARISVAPMRFGAGVKGKVNQSMALGVPTVVSSIAAEGMFLTHGENTLIADDPGSFAEAALRLFDDRELWERIADGGRKNVRDYFSVEAASRRIDEVLALASARSYT